MSSSDARKEVLGWLQLFAIILAIGGMVMTVGKKDQELAESRRDIDALTQASKDLAAATANNAMDIRENATEIRNIKSRLDRLESRQP